MGFAESSVTKIRVFWAQMECDLWATLPVEAGPGFQPSDQIPRLAALARNDKKVFGVGHDKGGGHLPQHGAAPRAGQLVKHQHIMQSRLLDFEQP